MGSVLFKGAWVLGHGIKDVGVRDGCIDLVGAGCHEDYQRVIDGQNHALLPGFVNTHGHAAMTMFRGVADDLPLKEWLENKIWPLEDQLGQEHVYWATMLAIVEMLKSGTTTFTDMYFFEDAVARAAEESGIRAVLSRGITYGPNFQHSLAESREFVQTWHGQGGGRITTLLGPHAPYTCPPPHLNQVLDLAAELNVPLQIHLSESPAEVQDSYGQYGYSPVVVLEKAGMFELPVLAAHCVNIDVNDIDILARHDVRVSHNPTSNLKLGNGIAPVVRLLDSGVTVGLGTDGAASNNNLDMMKEMQLAALLQKGVNNDSTVLSAKQALEMATSMGGRAVFLDDQVGKISPGMKADIILLDLNKPHLVPQHNVAAHLVYSAQATDVDLVMVNGNILVEGGRLTTLDEQRIMYEASRYAQQLTEV